MTPAFLWDVIWLVIATLAACRLTSLVARERGPFALGVRLRSLFGVHHHPDGSPAWESGEVLLNPVTPWAWLDGFLHEIARGMTCVWCCSVWVSLAATLALRHFMPTLVFDAVSYLLVSLAMSLVVIALDRMVF